MKYRIGIDVGGTFTDVVLVDKEGNIFATKAPSTPRDQSIGIMDALDKTAKKLNITTEELLRNTIYFSHGSTVATNALVERRGVKAGLLTTKGFGDVLYMRRQSRKYIYDPFQNISIPLIPRNLTIEISERVDSEGNVRKPINEQEVREAIQKLKRIGVKAIAVCFLFSYLNPRHERRAKEIIQEEFPGVYATVSSEVMPTFREYERTSTTVINAYVGPIMKQYLSSLRKKLLDRGLPLETVMMTSNGGVVSLTEACKAPVICLASGPAGGVIGGVTLGGMLGYKNLITFDMGGTSTDVSLVSGGELGYISMRGYEIDHGDTHPLSVPLIDIHSIGAGGGSIAWVDPTGALRVGPQSQGADPGPACYNLGGDEACVTDADLVVGYLNPQYFCGGDVKIYPDLSKEAINERVAKPLSMDLTDAARGIFKVVNANMMNAIRVVSVERGYDPQNYVLVSFGAAGSVHATRLMQELSIPKAIVSMMACGFSAFGLLVADVMHYFVHTVLKELSRVDIDKLAELYREIETKGVEKLRAEGIPDERIQTVWAADMRYLGQAHEVITPAPSGNINENWLRTLYEKFNKEHERLYLHSHPGEPAELVNVRVITLGATVKPKLRDYPLGSESPEKALKLERAVFWEEYNDYVKTPIYERARLEPNNMIEGPAIIEEPLTTTVIPPHVKAEVDVYRNIILSL